MSKIRDTYSPNGIPNGENWINEAEDEEVKLFRRFQRHPLLFVEQVLGIRKENGFYLSNQQKELLRTIGDLTFAKKLAWDAEHSKDKSLQENLRDSVKQLRKKFGISVRSGKSTGKSSCASFIIFWFLCCHSDAKIIAIGPTEASLLRVLLAECNIWYNKMNSKGDYIFSEPWRSMLMMGSDSIRVIQNGKPSLEWGCFIRVSSRTADEGVAKSKLSGSHSNNLLILVDEATGCPDSLFTPIEDTLSGRNNLCLLLWNPQRTSGYAYNTHFHSTQNRYWFPLHWNAEQSDLVSKSYITTLEEKYGRSSNQYRISVQGEPPIAEDGCMIPYDWILNSISKEIEQGGTPCKVLGIDVGVNRDSTIACYREGMKVHWMKKINSTDLVEQSIMIKRLINEIGGIDYLCIDSIGVGAGIYHILRKETEFTTKGVVVSSKATDTKYRLLRDELWWKLRTYLENGLLSLPDIEELKEEITTIKYDLLNSKIVVESKDSIRKRMGRSCDYSDSLNLTFFIDDLDINSKMSIIKHKKQDKYDKMFANIGKPEKSWMSY